MELKKLVADFIAQPNPLWSVTLAERLVGNYLQFHGDTYSLSSCITKGKSKDRTLEIPGHTDSFTIVVPSEDIMFFFEEHGLTPFPESQILANAAPQIDHALDLFSHNPLIKSFIGTILRSLVVIKAEQADTDVSYSHPDIPFSIFFSICDKLTLQNTFRIAESILHESMHLLLTLVEGVLPMIQQGTKETYYSPWRDEDRPVKGVLHGLFVFTAVLDFYVGIKGDFSDGDIIKFINNRIASITQELDQVTRFQHSAGLTEDGQRLSSNLLLQYR